MIPAPRHQTIEVDPYTIYYSNIYLYTRACMVVEHVMSYFTAYQGKNTKDYSNKKSPSCSVFSHSKARLLLNHSHLWHGCDHQLRYQIFAKCALNCNNVFVNHELVSPYNFPPILRVLSYILLSGIYP